MDINSEVEYIIIVNNFEIGVGTDINSEVGYKMVSQIWVGDGNIANSEDVKGLLFKTLRLEKRYR